MVRIADFSIVSYLSIKVIKKRYRATPFLWRRQFLHWQCRRTMKRWQSEWAICYQFIEGISTFFFVYFKENSRVPERQNIVSLDTSDKKSIVQSNAPTATIQMKGMAKENLELTAKAPDRVSFTML